MKLRYYVLAMLIMPCLAFAASEKADNTLGVNEVVMFKTKDNYTSKQVVMIADGVTSILKTYPGFISRNLSENVNNPHEWVDVVRWASLSDALAAAKKITTTHQMKNFVAGAAKIWN